jgi:peptidoglycan-associated lipoprotein
LLRRQTVSPSLEPIVNRPVSVILAASLVVMVPAACRHSPTPAPAPARGPNTDSIAAENVRRAEAARRDSIARATAARAEAARRDSIARADAARRAAAAEAEARAAIVRPVYFNYDADSLRADAVALLDDKVSRLRDLRDAHLRIEGHADDRGSDEYNLVLGQRRAAAVRRYLVARGIDDARLETVSFGEQRPACSGEEESCWRLNRRDEFTIIAGTAAQRGSRP